MPSGIHQVTDIPADKVGDVVSDFYADGAETVEVLKQDNALFTVKAYFKATRSTAHKNT